MNNRMFLANISIGEFSNGCNARLCVLCTGQRTRREIFCFSRYMIKGREEGEIRLRTKLRSRSMVREGYRSGGIIGK